MPIIKNEIGTEVRKRLEDIRDIKALSEESDVRSKEAKTQSDESLRQSDITQKQLVEAMSTGTPIEEVGAAHVDGSGTVYDTIGDRMTTKEKIVEDAYVDIEGNVHPNLKARIDGIEGPFNVVAKAVEFVDADFPRLEGETDDTGTLTRLFKAAGEARGKAILTRRVYQSKSIQMTNGEFYGAMVEAVNREGVVIVADVGYSDKFLSYKGGSGRLSNVGFKNVRVIPLVKGNGTFLYIDGQCGARFENIYAADFNRGIHLINESDGAFTELNYFDIALDYCNEAVRIEKGSAGDESFHGNEFHFLINVGENQIGINHVSGYLYNARFNIKLWAHSTSSVLINADGNAEHNVGDITYESFEKGQVTGAGRFFFSGFLRGIGGLSDNSAKKSNGTKVFACTNYHTPVTNSSLVGQIGSVGDVAQTYNGINPGLYMLTADGKMTPVINGYKNGEEGKLYLMQTPFGKDMDGGELGFHLNLSGREIKSYNASGTDFKTSDNKTALTIREGRFTGEPGITATKTLSANAGVMQTLTFPGYNSPNIMFLVTVRVTGNGVDRRRSYIANHSGVGGTGSATQLSSHDKAVTSGSIINNTYVNTSANFALELTTDVDVTVQYYAMGIGRF